MSRTKLATASDFHFQGFPEPNTHQTPNVLIDWILGHPEVVSDAELRVLLYLSRRICGFSKECDAVSFNQFLRGIRKRGGEVLDHGCGIKSPTTLSLALRTVEVKGFIVSEKHNNDRGGKGTTVYRLRFWRPGVRDHEQVEPNRSEGGTTATVVGGTTASVGGVLQQLYIQSKVVQPKEEQYESRNSNAQNGKNEKGQPRGTVSIKLKGKGSERGEERDEAAYEQLAITRSEQDGDTSQNSSWRDTLARRATELATRQKQGSTLSPAVRQLLKDTSAEFHDEAPRSTVTRAKRLYEQSGLSPNDYYQAMYQARANAKAATIKKRSASGLPNRMPLFLEDLERQVGLK